MVDAWVSKTHEDFPREGSSPSLGTANPPGLLLTSTNYLSPR